MFRSVRGPRGVRVAHFGKRSKNTKNAQKNSRSKTLTWIQKNAQNSSGKHARSLTPPKSLEKACFSLEPQHKSRKNVNITLEVSSTFLVLSYVSTNIAILVAELTISAGRASKTLKNTKSVLCKIFNGARDQWKTLEIWAYSYSNGSTFIVEKLCFRCIWSISIAKSEFEGFSQQQKTRSA